ncbi:38969_t:CDS:2, partial [Gigaspora margarita]
MTDLFETNQSLCVQQVKFACENLVFFYLKNHGFNEKDVEETFHRVKITLTLKNQKFGDHKESFNFSKFDDNDDPLAQILPLFNEKKSLFSSLSK